MHQSGRQRPIVSLPWAQSIWGPPIDERAVPSTPSARPASPHQPPQSEPLRTDYSASSPATAAHAQLGTPYRPEPVVADEDRVPLSEDALVGLSVALDVLATATRRIPETAAVAQELTEALLQVGSHSGISPEGIESLLAYALDTPGDEREQLTQQLAACTTEVVGHNPSEAKSTPDAVCDAIRRIETATDVVVREARLRIDAQLDRLTRIL